MTLTELYNAKGYAYYPTDKGTSHNYLTFYELLFSQYRESKIKIFEVGIFMGGSIKLWEDYFINAEITACDIEKHPNLVKLSRTKCFYTDIRKIDFNFFEDNSFTIAIDDGSHKIQDQLFFIEHFYPKIKKGGMLIIEDVYNIKNNILLFKQFGSDFSVVYNRHTGRKDNILLIYQKL